VLGARYLPGDKGRHRPDNQLQVRESNQQPPKHNLGHAFGLSAGGSCEVEFR
jgi:hypothetical protein